MLHFYFGTVSIMNHSSFRYGFCLQARAVRRQLWSGWRSRKVRQMIFSLGVREWSVTKTLITRTGFSFWSAGSSNEVDGRFYFHRVGCRWQDRKWMKLTSWLLESYSASWTLALNIIKVESHPYIYVLFTVSDLSVTKLQRQQPWQYIYPKHVADSVDTSTSEKYSFRDWDGQSHEWQCFMGWCYWKWRKFLQYFYLRVVLIMEGGTIHHSNFGWMYDILCIIENVVYLDFQLTAWAVITGCM